MKNTLSVTCILVCLLMSLLLQCRSQEILKQQIIAKEPGSLKPYECITIDELNQMILSKNIIKTQINICGIVIKRFICPPCPEGVDCEQCPQNHIVVSDGKSEVTIVCHQGYFEENEEYCISLKTKMYMEGFPFGIAGWEKNPREKCQP